MSDISEAVTAAARELHDGYLDCDHDDVAMCMYAARAALMAAIRYLTDEEALHLAGEEGFLRGYAKCLEDERHARDIEAHGGRPEPA